MTENDVITVIYERMVEVSKYATSVDLQYLASTLATLDRVGKPDAYAETMKHFTESLVETQKIANKERKDLESNILDKLKEKENADVREDS